jgi:ferredoxin
MAATDVLIKTAVRDLFSQERVELVIGFEKNSLAFGSRPCFVRSADEAERLVWDSFCANNLAAYLPRFFKSTGTRQRKEPLPKIGIVAKACDARSAVGLLKENQVPRENLTIIAVPCKGMVDSARVTEAVGGEPVTGCTDGADGTLELTTRGAGQTRLDREEVLLEACSECRHPSFDAADVQIEGESRVASDAPSARVSEIGDRPIAERWRYFSEEISRCIRCYACRQACPNCYCTTCFATQKKPSWIGAGDETSDLVLFQLIRAFHQAGRCVGCDACVRACPVGIDLGLINRKIGMDVEELFDYVPGLSMDAPAPLTTFDDNDSQGFITEP